MHRPGTREARMWQGAALILAEKLAAANQSDCSEILLENARLMADEAEPPRPPKLTVEFRLKEMRSDKQFP